MGVKYRITQFAEDHIRRNKDICIRVLGGETLSSVSKGYELTNSRVSQILGKMLMLVDEKIFSESCKGMKSCNIDFLRERKDVLIPLIKESKLKVDTNQCIKETI